jgi:hypothetical protein
MNTIGSWQNHAISLGLPPNTPVKKQIDEFIRRWDKFPVTPERRANPAWAENTVDGDDITCSIFCRCSVSTMATAVLSRQSLRRFARSARPGQLR